MTNVGDVRHVIGLVKIELYEQFIVELEYFQRQIFNKTKYINKYNKEHL